MNVHRPRLCVVCHVDATWALEEYRQAVSIKQDGTVLRYWEPVRTFYCDQHIR